MIYLRNDSVEATINPLGAELQKLVGRESGINYLWSGDPAYWGKFSPVLFPIVGTLKDNHYSYKGSFYTLHRHGFAREKLFSAEQVSHSEAVFTLQDDESTRVVYPFRFVLQLKYKIEGNRLTVTYTVYNPGEDELFFSIGAHPAFAVPIKKELAYTDYYLQFNEPETAVRWGLQDGLLQDTAEPFLVKEQQVHLSPELFARDAIVLKGLQSTSVALRTAIDSRGLSFGIAGWPHLGVWAAPGAPFVCIEPWQGHADPVSHDGDITHKPGIVKLAASEDWQKSWWVELF
jgi:galactose mutarotase-like enzyme